jgi:hypothetical protein
MPQVFISYKHDDGDFVDTLKRKIEEAGFTGWTDDNLLAGEEWREMIDRAIRDSDALIVIMTPEARASEYVTYEWSFALGMGVPVIPVMLKKTPLHPRLEVLQYLDFGNRKLRPWDELMARLQSLDKKPARTSKGKRPSAAVQESLEKLLDRNWYARRDAAQALGEARDPAAVPGLARTLRDRSPRVREAAAVALGWIGDVTAIPDLIKALQDDNSKVCQAAADALKRFGTPDALAAIQAAGM